MFGLLTSNGRRRVGLEMEFPTMENVLRNALRRAVDVSFENETSNLAQVDVSDKEISVTIPVPGRKPESIDIEVVGSCLTVKVGKCSCCVHADNQKSYLFKERNCNEFEESLRLPVAVQGAKANAKIVDGVLLVTIPRLDAELPKTHVVKVN
jgi:HSP20 family protein